MGRFVPTLGIAACSYKKRFVRTVVREACCAKGTNTWTQTSCSQLPAMAAALCWMGQKRANLSFLAFERNKQRKNATAMTLQNDLLKTTWQVNVKKLSSDECTTALTLQNDLLKTTWQVNVKKLSSDECNQGWTMMLERTLPTSEPVLLNSCWESVTEIEV